jgi:hypothetical protein
MKKLPITNFNLTRVKLGSEGLYCEFSEQLTSNGESTIVDHTIKCKSEPHPDLKNAMNGLKVYLIDVLNIEEGLHLAIKYLKGEQKKKAEDLRFSILENISISSLTISGLKDETSVLISATMESKTGKKVAINSPLINLTNEVLGYENELEELTEDVIKEVHAYLFNNKRAQVGMFDDTEEGGEAVLEIAKDIIKQPKEPGLN